jgi:hypothetical protein
LPHGETVIPDFRHVSDPTLIEFHHIDIVTFDFVYSWSTWAALSGIRALEGRVTTHATSLFIHRERAKFIVSVRDRTGDQPLHRLGIACNGIDFHEYIRLR